MDSLGPYLLGPNDTPENGIYTGDARELAKAIPDESIDLIFTDPVYDKIDDYKWLAETGARVLIEGGNLIAQTGQYYLPQVISGMDGSLDYVWVIAEHQFGRAFPLFKHRILCHWKPYLWYSKGKRQGEWVFDWIKGGMGDKKHHAWGNSPHMFIDLISKLSNDDRTTFDPFTGGGTVPAVCKMLNRKYLAFEIDPDVAQMARDRVRHTQPPLPIEMPTQEVLL